MERFGIRPTIYEGIRIEYGLELGPGSEKDRNLQPETFLDGLGNRVGEMGDNVSRGLEDDIAALDVGAPILGARCGKERGQEPVAVFGRTPRQDGAAVIFWGREQDLQAL